MVEMKKSMTVEELCFGLPSDFSTYFNYIWSLAFWDKPNYDYIRKIFHDLFVQEGFQNDHGLDWIVKRNSQLTELPRLDSMQRLSMLQVNKIEVLENACIRELLKSQTCEVDWRALLDLCRKLMHEHIDFFCISQHPLADSDARSLASTLHMPQRMGNCVLLFLENSHCNLPAAGEHMRTFINITYTTITLLVETSPNFISSWKRYLADIRRYEKISEDSKIH